MNSIIQSRWLPLVPLLASNVFMTFAWYGHLKFRSKPLLLVVFIGFATFYLHEKLRWNHLAAFLCILATVAFTFLPKPA